VVNRTLAGSAPDWGQIGHIEPPEGAPNVLLVLIDDAGFGNPSTFGGPVDTPNYTRLADAGLRYNRFHVTALCSPTRAALLTGRNHHSVGFGSIGELSSGFPGYTAFVPKDCAPFPKILQENGYSTAAFGKWHMTPWVTTNTGIPKGGGSPHGSNPTSNIRFPIRTAPVDS
jgi:arylsulfatase A-like enzyme